MQQINKVRRVKKIEPGRDFVRMLILLALNNVLPFGLTEDSILAIVRSIRTDETAMEVRCELNFFAEENGWIEIRKGTGESWFATLTQHGVNLMQNTIKAHRVV